MKVQYQTRALLSACISLFLAGHIAVVSAGEPQDQVRQTIDAVLAILRDDALNTPERTQERRDKIRQVVTKRFGFEEMAKRALGRHWRDLTPAQQNEFVALFSDLLERSYVGKIESASGSSDFEVLYTQERIDQDGYAIVRTEVVNKRDLNTDIEYRLLRRNGDWEAYDIIIEGVSLVNNYRTQFSTIIRQKSYEALVQQMKTKMAQETVVP
jgi:phospholipid transport system substrate-binding protein